MVEEISNRTLAVLVMVAIAISLGSAILSLNKLATLGPGMTGYALSSTGTVNLSISTTGSLRFAISLLDFGAGSINTTGGNQFCHMSSNVTTGVKDTIANCVGFNAAANLDSLQLENDGNTNLTVNITATSAAAAFLGGTSPGFTLYTTNNESGSCATVAPASPWGTSVTVATMNVCGGAGGLSYMDNSDSINLHFNLTIPYDGTTGTLTNTITATGTVI